MYTVNKRVEEEDLEICPQEIKEFECLSIFNREKMNSIKKQKVEVTPIGNVDLHEDEIALSSLPPKFAIRRTLDEVDIETDYEMCMAKTRYQIHRERKLLNSKEYNGEDEHEKETKRLRILTSEEIKELEEIGDIEAEGR